MKIHLAKIQWTATAAIVAGALAQPAVAQYPPYRALPAMKATAQPAATAPQVPYVAAREGSVQAPAQRVAMAPQAYPTTQAPAQQAYPTTQAPAPQAYPTTQAAPYYVAQATPPYQTTMPSSLPTVSAYPQSAAPAVGYERYSHVAQQPAPVPPQGDTNAAAANASASAAASNAAATNGSTGQMTTSAYANGVYNSNAGGGGCNNGYGYGNGCGNYGDVSGCCDGGHQNIWFGGVYFLYMERDNSDPAVLSAVVPDSSVTNPYYPSADRYVLAAGNYDFQPGVEVRFGSTFTIGDSCDTCTTGCGSYGYGYGGCNTCAPCCSQDIYAWEVGAWGLLEDENDTTYVVDQIGGNGMYGMVDFRGLEYNGPGGYAPVNTYYGSDMPLAAPSTEVLAQCMRTNFQAQNLELNIFRIPFCGPGCGSCGSDSCGCDDGRMCAYSAYGSCGVRFFRIDDDFFYGTEFRGGTQTAFDGWSFADDNELFYDVEVDNNLIGPQLGWTMNYSVGCKWNFFMNSTFGVFENHINSRQQMYSGGGGTVRFVNDASTFDLDDSKDDISFLGEMRLGGSYDVTCHWRAVLAYRAIAATGLATSVGQIPTNFYNSTAVGTINSNESMIVHGLQIGAECKY